MNSKLGFDIDNNSLHIPEPSIINNCESQLKYPYVFVADDAFSLKPYMLKPYPNNDVCDREQTIYTYRACRARRVIENSFGILASRF